MYVMFLASLTLALTALTGSNRFGGTNGSTGRILGRVKRGVPSGELRRMRRGIL